MSSRPGFATVTPYLTTPDPDALVAFLAAAFGAEETLRERGGAGGWHVEVRIGDSMVMLGGPAPASNTTLFMYVDDVDGWHARALAAGASSLEDPHADGQGLRAAVTDPAGNHWYLGRPG